MGNGIRDKKRKQQNRTRQMKQDEEIHIPDTLERQIEAWVDEAGIIIEPALKPTGTHNEDTTHNNSRHQGNGRGKQCTSEKSHRPLNREEDTTSLRATNKQHNKWEISQERTETIEPQHKEQQKQEKGSNNKEPNTHQTPEAQQERQSG